MAGLAEAAYAITELIIVAGLLLAAALILFGWSKRSFVAPVVACVLLAALGWFLRPWALMGRVAGIDPDEQSWLATFKTLGIPWFIVSLVGVFAAATAGRRPRRLRSVQ